MMKEGCGKNEEYQRSREKERGSSRGFKGLSTWKRRSVESMCGEFRYWSRWSLVESANAHRWHISVERWLTVANATLRAGVPPAERGISPGITMGPRTLFFEGAEVFLAASIRYDSPPHSALRCRVRDYPTPLLFSYSETHPHFEIQLIHHDLWHKRAFLVRRRTANDVKRMVDSMLGSEGVKLCWLWRLQAKYSFQQTS